MKPFFFLTGIIRYSTVHVLLTVKVPLHAPYNYSVRYESSPVCGAVEREVPLIASVQIALRSRTNLLSPASCLMSCPDNEV